MFLGFETIKGKLLYSTFTLLLGTFVLLYAGPNNPSNIYYVGLIFAYVITISLIIRFSIILYKEKNESN